jgi:hypothetical protein
MKIRQISIVLENTAGKLFELTGLLHAHQIDIRSIFVSEETEFSSVHVIVDKPELAAVLLKTHGYFIKEVDVFALKAEDKPGGLMAILAVLKQHDLNIEYVYGFGEKHDNKAIFIFRISDIDKALTVIQSGAVDPMPTDRVTGTRDTSSWTLIEHL